MTKNIYKTIRQKLKFSFQWQAFVKQLIIDVILLTSIIMLFMTSFSFINILLIPGFMFRQFSILHEAVHGLSHPNDKINEAIGILAGAFCFTPYAAWKAAHLKHHYWTGNLEQDPTFAILKQYNQYSELKKSSIEFTWKHGMPLISLLQHVGFWTFSFKIKMSAKNFLSLFIPLAIYGICFPQLTLLSAVFGLIGFGVYLRFYEDMIIPQHVGLYSNDDVSHHPHAWDQPLVTRTWYMNPVLEKYVVLNMNYHTEHHLFMDLPWHELKNTHKALVDTNEPPLNIVNYRDWMSRQRKKPFRNVIIPVSSLKQNTIF